MRGSNLKIIFVIIVIFTCACSSSQIREQDAAIVYSAPRTYFFEASGNGDIATVMRLIEEKLVDVNLTDSYQWTGLMYAIPVFHLTLRPSYTMRSM